MTLLCRIPAFRALAAVIVAGALASCTAPVSEHEGISASGFLADYSILRKAPDQLVADYVYIAPDADARLASYVAIMVDQPLVHISPDSEVRAAKPDNLKILADFLRDEITGGLLRGGLHIVEEPGPDTLYLRAALTNLEVAPRSGPESYAPIAIEGLSDEEALALMAESVDVVGATLEGEITDSVTGEILAVVLVSGRGKAGAGIPLDDIGAAFRWLGARLDCWFDNANRPATERTACTPDELASSAAHRQGQA